MNGPVSSPSGGSHGNLGGAGGPSWTAVEGAECVEIGWALRREVWGRGYATEIGRAAHDPS